jgi:hypothetical protein
MKNEDSLKANIESERDAYGKRVLASPMGKNKGNFFVFSPNEARTNAINRGIASEMEIKRKEAILKAHQSFQANFEETKVYHLFFIYLDSSIRK